MRFRSANPAPTVGEVASVDRQLSRASSQQSLRRGAAVEAKAQEERLFLERELRELDDEVAAFAKEARDLRTESVKEQERRSQETARLSELLRSFEQENQSLHSKLQQLCLQGNAKHADATELRKSIVAKTMELEKSMREFQQSSQEGAFSRMTGIAGAVSSLCATPRVPDQADVNGTGAPGTPVHGGAKPPSEAAWEEDPGDQSGTVLDAETQLALKRRLQALGDVVVYSNSKFEACSASGRPIPPGSLRIRPRRCDHVFLVECLMPYWADGLCPVCRCSFALDCAQEGAMNTDEWDRCSSVSTSVSQTASLMRPRPPFQRTLGRGRSPSPAQRRSPSRGAVSEASGAEGHDVPEARRAGRSPPARSSSPQKSASGVSRSSSAAARERRPL